MYDGKYIKLYDFLKHLDQKVDQTTLTCKEIEDILQFKLPDSAYKYPAWWANEQEGSHSHSRSWRYAGWKTSDVKPGKTVTFVRATAAEKGDTPKMTAKNPLLEAFNQTTYQIAGHGKRNMQMLKDALQEIDGDVASDVYGSGKIIEDFQNKIAQYLGKETAVFFPSGTMAQQVAVRIWCDDKGLKKVAYHPLSHLEIHEEDGLRELHGIESVLLGDKDSVIGMQEVLNLNEDVACLLLELPQREIGGQLPDYADLVAISAYCREKGIKLHLDGARLFEILPYYQKTAAEVCALFDSVYVSFYKGIGGIAGAILAGDEAFTKQSKVWKRRHGGDLISLYPYIISADYYFDQRVPNMAKYYAEAKELAALYNECHAIETKPTVPVSNMFHVHIHVPKEQLEPLLTSLYEETGLGLTAYLREVDAATCYYEISIGDCYSTVPKETLQKAFQLLDEKIRAVQMN